MIRKMQLLLVLNNRHLGRASEMVNSIDPCDLYALISDLQRKRQIENEWLLSFSARLQTHLAKLIASVNKQTLTQKIKQAQLDLIESKPVNSLLTDLEPKIGQILRANDLEGIVSVVSCLKWELQLQGNDTQNFNKYLPPVASAHKPNSPSLKKQYTFCKRIGHTIYECIMRSRHFQPNPSKNQNFSSTRLNPFAHQTNQSHFQSKTFRNNSGFQPDSSSHQQRLNQTSLDNNTKEYTIWIILISTIILVISISVITQIDTIKKMNWDIPNLWVIQATVINKAISIA